MKRSLVALAAAALAALSGCSSLGGHAVRTGSVRLPARSGPVAIFAGGLHPRGQTLGMVEVHGSQSEGAIEVLLPLFARKVQQLGGDAAVIDDVVARFDVVARPYVETFAYPCGAMAMCTGSRFYSVNDQVMTVTMRGRAMSMEAR